MVSKEARGIKSEAENEESLSETIVADATSETNDSSEPMIVASSSTTAIKDECGDATNVNASLDTSENDSSDALPAVSQIVASMSLPRLDSSVSIPRVDSEAVLPSNVQSMQNSATEQEAAPNPEQRSADPPSTSVSKGSASPKGDRKSTGLSISASLAATAASGVVLPALSPASPMSQDNNAGSSTPANALAENTGRWTAEEHRLFLQGLEQHGKGWKKIASLIKSRTVVQIRTHAQKYFQKLAKARMAAANGSGASGNGATMATLTSVGLDEMAASLMGAMEGLSGSTTAGGAAAAAAAAVAGGTSLLGAGGGGATAANITSGMSIPPGGVIVAGTNVGGGILSVGAGVAGLNLTNAGKRRRILSALQRNPPSASCKRRMIRSVVASAQRQLRAETPLNKKAKNLSKPTPPISIRPPIRVAPALAYFVLPHYRIHPRSKTQDQAPPSLDSKEAMEKAVASMGYDVVDSSALEDSM
jgi:SHAQKYF class myb-like DNA-binding protein